MTPVLTWLGQAGFLIEAGGARLLVDPFFSENEARLRPPLSTDEYGSRIDRLLVTHEHIDHLDRESLGGIAERLPPCTLFIRATATQPAATPRLRRLRGRGRRDRDRPHLLPRAA